MEELVLSHDGVAIRLIDTEEALAEAVAQMQQSKELALDLEFDQNRYTYGFNLCLIQVSAGGGVCFIIDPFAIENLQPLFEVFENPDIVKIIHHSNNDIMLLDKLGCRVKGLVDTDVAAKIINYERSSLATVLKEEFGQEIDKSQQSSNWNKRPLTEEQLVYAAIDVIYLHQVRARLEGEIEAQGRMHWLKEENAILEGIRYSETENPHLKLRNAFKLNLYQQYILKHLYAFREETAKRFNKPAPFVIGNEALVELAANPNTDIHEWLNHTKGIHGGLKKPRNEKLLQDALNHARKQAQLESISHEYPANHYKRPFRTAESEKRKEDLVEVQKYIVAKYGEFASRLVINQSLITDYSMSGQLNCYKQYATAIVLEAAEALDITLPAPTVKSKNKS